MAHQGSQDEIQRHLEGLLLHPREELDKELKGWLNLQDGAHKADLAKAILALANHGGGYITIGFAEADEGQWVPDTPHPDDLSEYSQDLINSIVERYADPSFHCDVYHETHPESGIDYPIIVVPGGHTVPIRSKRDGPDQQHIRKDAYYIRRPGPSSEPPQSSQEWDALIRRCVRASKAELAEDIRQVIVGYEQGTVPPDQGNDGQQTLNNWVDESEQRFQTLLHERLANEQPSRFVHGYWTAAYIVQGHFDVPTRKDFLSWLEKVKGNETGWPVWLVPTWDRNLVYPYNGTIECWLAESDIQRPDISDFWRASPHGKMYLLRGYHEDGRSNVEPGTIFDVTIPVWRIGECLLHAARLTYALTAENVTVFFRASWHGLEGRALTAWANPHRQMSENRKARQNTVVSQTSVTARQIDDNLPDIVEDLTKPLYEVFSFTELPSSLFQEEIGRMQRGKRQL